MQWRDFFLLSQIKKNPGISLKILVKESESSTKARLDVLEKQKLVKHTERTYLESDVIIDTIGRGNDCFVLTDQGLIAAENKFDITVEGIFIFIVGFIAGFLINKLT